MRDKLKKADKILIRIQDNICAVLFMIVFVLCLLQIFFRNIVYVPVPWTEEFARVGLMYLTFFGAAVGLRTKAHPAVDFLTSKLPLRPRMIVAFLAELLIMAVSLVFVIYGWKYVKWMFNDHSTTYYYSKSTWFFGLPIAGLIMTIYGIRNLVIIVASFIKNRDLEKEEDADE